MPALGPISWDRTSRAPFAHRPQLLEVLPGAVALVGLPGNRLVGFADEQPMPPKKNGFSRVWVIDFRENGLPPFGFPFAVTPALVRQPLAFSLSAILR